MSDAVNLSPSDRRQEHVAQLVHALTTEVAILGELRETLVKQREAVAQNDQTAVEDSIHAMGRIILTLEETRRQRHALLGLVCDGEAASLNELDAHFSPVPTALAEARSAVRGQSVAAANDLAINQHVLDRVLHAGDAFLQRLFSHALEHSPSYGSSIEDDRATEAMLVNRTV